MNADQEAKVKWFMLRTGCDAAEAEAFLKEAKFKIDIAIQLRKLHYDHLYRKS